MRRVLRRLCIVSTSVFTPCVYSSRLYLTLRHLMPSASAVIALSRVFLYFLVLLLLLGMAFQLLLALALLPGLAEAWWLLRIFVGVAIAPWLPAVFRWITSPWLGWAWCCHMWLQEVHVVIPLSPFSRLVHHFWVIYSDPVSCSGLQTSNILV